MLQHGIAIHDTQGVIQWFWISEPLLADHNYVGTLPWHWVAPEDQEQCQSDLGMALLGKERGVRRYRLDKTKFGADLAVLARFFRTACEPMPLLTLAYFVPAVILSLSPRERDIAKLLPLHASKEIAKQLKVSPSTVETVRQRLGVKLGLTGNALVSWCAEHREII